MLDIFSTYADTTYVIQKKGKLAGLTKYFIKKDLSKYVDSYIKPKLFMSNLSYS